jgi:hypothetical protein
MMSTGECGAGDCRAQRHIREAEQTLSTQLRDAEVFTRAITDNLKAARTC